MMRSAAVLAVLTASSLLSSCVVPWPNQRVDVEGVSGEVVDGESGKPIANALVKVSHGWSKQNKVHYHKERRTSSRGRFEVAPQGPWAWGYFIGPISGPVFGLKPDLGMRVPAPVTGLEVWAEGYRTWRWQGNDSRDERPPERIRLERKRERSGSS